MKRTALLSTAFTSLLCVATSSHASTFTCGAGDVGCLIAAINGANGNGEPDNTIRLASGTYELTSVDNDTHGYNGLPSITSAMSIVSDTGGTVVITRSPSGPSFRLLHVAANASLTLDGLTLTRGNVVDSTSASPNATLGGALYNDGGALTIARSTFSRNGANRGGAIDHEQGMLTISDSAIDSNRGDDSTPGVRVMAGTATIARVVFDSNAGGIWGCGVGLFTGTLNIQDSRFIANSCNGSLYVGGGTATATRLSFDLNSGAALFTGGGLTTVSNSTFARTSLSALANGVIFRAGGTLLLALITVTGNVNHIATGLLGGVIVSNNGGQIRLTNSTVAGNSIPARGTMSGVTVENSIVMDESPVTNCALPANISRGHNIFFGAAALCGSESFQASDQVVDPRLGAFADTGQPGGGYLPLLDGSPAIDARDPVLCGPNSRDQLGHLDAGVCDIGAVEYAGTALGVVSPDGTRVPTASAIIDDDRSSWTLGPNGETRRNSLHIAGGYGTQLLWHQGAIFTLGLDGNWWQLLNGVWFPVGANDPSGAPTGIPSPSGTRVPPASLVVDLDGASWRIGAGGETLRNGVHAGIGYGSQYLWYQNVLFVLGADNNWWRWTGSTWVFSGASDPAGGSGGPATSPSGTRSTTIVDADGATWRLGSRGETLRNGVQANGGFGSLYLWYQNALYVLGTDNNWWRWTGEGWVFAGASDPSGGSSGGASPSGTHATTVVDSNGATWTLGANGETLRNGTQAAGGVGSLYLWYQDVLYVIGSDNNWWRWTGSGWVFVGPTDPSQ